MSRPAEQNTTVVTLRALDGEPLRHKVVAGMVKATAHAIAERQGIRVVDLSLRDDRVTVMLQADDIVGIGFAAELRRLTTSWYKHKYGVDHLWGEPE